MFQVADKCCNECLFSPNKIVSDARKMSVLRGCMQNDSHFVCHKASIKGADVCCRGFYNTMDSQMIRISKRLNMVEFVDVESE